MWKSLIGFVVGLIRDKRVPLIQAQVDLCNQHIANLKTDLRRGLLEQKRLREKCRSLEYNEKRCQQDRRASDDERTRLKRENFTLMAELRDVQRELLKRVPNAPI